MSRQAAAILVLLPSILIAGILAAARGDRKNIPTRHAETRLLLLTDGPLAAAPAPATPNPGLAGGEVIVNSELVAQVELDGGLLMRPLHADSAGRSISIVDWPANIELPRHWHSATERLWMLEGSIAGASGSRVGPQEFWEAAAQISMGPFTSTGSVFVFLGEGPFETHTLAAHASAPKTGEPITIDPDTIAWQSLASLAGIHADGDIKLLRAASETDRGVYLLRLGGTPAPDNLAFNSTVEGYVLSGAFRLTDPYHGVHVLSSGFYFGIPAGSQFSLSSAE